MSMDRGTLTRLSMQRLSKRFSRNRDYNRVDDINDTRVPLHNEDIFQHGLKFKAKFIGTLEIARPQSKVDIITAMRRIRYEYKVKGIKKQRCQLDISTNGVKVCKRKRHRKRDYNEDEQLIMQHPIYRIFYVSHDSQDLKIFSYITRESSDNSFQCNVFKAYKKRMALHIVRSLGQAFDVCHKQNPKPKKKKSVKKDVDTSATSDTENKQNANNVEDVIEPRPKPVDSTPNGDDVNTAQDNINSTADDDPFSPLKPTTSNGSLPLIDFDPFIPLALPPPELQLADHTNSPPQSYASRPRPKPTQSVVQENPINPLIGLDNNLSKLFGDPIGESRTSNGETETQHFAAELSLLKDKLQIETTARIEAQARVEHLLLQNKDLLSHLQKLMVQLQQLQAFQMEQQSKKSATPPPTTVPDSTQTPPTTEPEDTLSEVTEHKDTSHDLSLNVSDLSHDLVNGDRGNDDEKILTDFNDDPFKPLLKTTPIVHDKETLDAAFTPIAVDN